MASGCTGYKRQLTDWFYLSKFTGQSGETLLTLAKGLSKRFEILALFPLRIQRSFCDRSCCLTDAEFSQLEGIHPYENFATCLSRSHCSDCRCPSLHRLGGAAGQ